MTYENLQMKDISPATIWVSQDYHGPPDSRFLIENLTFRDITSVNAGHKFSIGAGINRSNESIGIVASASSPPKKTPVVILDCGTELAHGANCHRFVLENIVHERPVVGANMSCSGVYGIAAGVSGIGPSCVRAEPQTTLLEA